MMYNLNIFSLNIYDFIEFVNSLKNLRETQFDIGIREAKNKNELNVYFNAQFVKSSSVFSNEHFHFNSLFARFSSKHLIKEKIFNF